MDRPDISRLNKNRSIYLKIGLITALMMVIFAFNWTSYTPIDESMVTLTIEDEEEIPVVRTSVPKPKVVPPPPVLKVTDEVVVTEPEFTTEPIPEKVEISKKTVEEPIEKKVIPMIEPAQTVAVVPEPEKAPEVDEIFTVVEEMPRFPGCEEVGTSKEIKNQCATNKLLNFLRNNIRYPNMARDAGIEGTVILSFVIGKQGQIEDIQVVRGVGGGCSQESVRVAKKMPDWSPGKQRGKPVKVKFHLPVKFRLR